MVADSWFMEGHTRRLVLFDMSDMEKSPTAVREVTFMYDPRYRDRPVMPVAEGGRAQQLPQSYRRGFSVLPGPFPTDFRFGI